MRACCSLIVMGKILLLNLRCGLQVFRIEFRKAILQVGLEVIYTQLLDVKSGKTVRCLVPCFSASVARDTAGARWCFPWKNPLRDTFYDFQKVFPMETQKVFLKEKSEKHIMCFFQVSHR